MLNYITVSINEWRDKMFDKLEEIEKKYNELTRLISDPDVISDQENWKKYMRNQNLIIQNLS